MKEESKEKIIKESRGVSWRHVSSASIRFRGRCAALGSTLRQCGERGRGRVPPGARGGTAVPPARGAPATLPSSSPNGHTCASLNAAGGGAIPQLACLHPRNPTAPAAGRAWGGGSERKRRGAGGSLPGPGAAPSPAEPSLPGKVSAKLCSALEDGVGQVGGGPPREAVPSQTPTSYSVMESPLRGGRMTQRSPRSQAPWSP